MSTARWGTKWADVDEEDDDEVVTGDAQSKTRFETKADDQGVKTVIEYTERDGKTYKVTRKVKQISVQKWTNKAMEQRKALEHFGGARGEEAKKVAKPVRNEEDVPMDLVRRNVVVAEVNPEDKFLEEGLSLIENLTKEKKVWTDLNRDKQEERDAADAKAAADAAKAAEPAAGAAKSAYVPPSLRGADGADGKGKGKGGDQEASLRVTNLSEDAKEGDLQELFGVYGRLQRVFLAKHMDTGLSKGFAFVTYYNRADAEKAIAKLNGHGYDNLIMQVMWAQPKA